MLPLEKTFWAARFGMLIDRFGMPWLINCGEPRWRRLTGHRQRRRGRIAVAIDRRSCHPHLIPMRLATAVLTASFAFGLSLAAQSPAQRPEMRELTDAFPGNPKVDQFALSADGQRTYFVNSAGEAWLFDRAHKTSTRLTAGPLWDLNVSPTGEALAYTKGAIVAATSSSGCYRSIPPPARPAARNAS